MRWFGKSWGAPICLGEDHIEAPQGELCVRCGREIQSHDQGVEIPVLRTFKIIEVRADWAVYHLSCFFTVVGVK